MRFEREELGRIDAAKGRSRSIDAMSTIVLGLFVALVVIGQFAARPHRSYLEATGDDFAAFYCAGSLAHAHADPYRVEPLRTCERTVSGGGGRAETVVDPAPLPGYAVAFFALVAFLPFAVAKALWFFSMVASLAIAALLLGRMTSFPSLYIFLGLCVADYESFQFGQLPPLVIAAICGAAYLLRARRDAPAAVCASIAMIEPHLGLPVCLALFACRPRTRPALAVVAIVFGAVSVIVTGARANVDYFTHVLSEQVAAELVAVDQYSLSHVLHLTGLHDRPAVLAGSISYLVMVGLGVWLARSSSRATGDEAYLALVPPAAAMLGGAYIHSLQFAAALPAAYLLASGARPARRLGWSALVVLIVPWEYLIAGKLYALSYLVALITLIVLTWSGVLEAKGASLRRRYARAATAAIGFVIALAIFGHLPSGERRAPGAASSGPSVAAVRSDADASQNWAAYLRSNPQLSVSSIRREADKLPTWLGIGLIIAAAFLAAKRTPAGAGRDAVLQAIPTPA